MPDATSRRRIRVQTQTTVTTTRGEHPVLMVAIGAQSALLLAAGPLARQGETLDLHLPGVGEDLVVTAGVESVEPVAEGTVMTVHFMVVERAVRQKLEKLLALLLAGDGGGERRHPRVRHDIPIGWSDDKQHSAQLEEISLAGVSMCTSDRPADHARLQIAIPDDRGGVRIAVRGKVANVRPSQDGRFSVGVAFESIDGATQFALEALLAELVRG